MKDDKEFDAVRLIEFAELYKSLGPTVTEQIVSVVIEGERDPENLDADALRVARDAFKPYDAELTDLLNEAIDACLSAEDAQRRSRLETQLNNAYAAAIRPFADSIETPKHMKEPKR